MQITKRGSRFGGLLRNIGAVRLISGIFAALGMACIASLLLSGCASAATAPHGSVAARATSSHPAAMTSSATRAIQTPTAHKGDPGVIPIPGDPEHQLRCVNPNPGHQFVVQVGTHVPFGRGGSITLTQTGSKAILALKPGTHITLKGVIVVYKASQNLVQSVVPILVQHTPQTTTVPSTRSDLPVFRAIICS